MLGDKLGKVLYQIIDVAIAFIVNFEQIQRISPLLLYLIMNMQLPAGDILSWKKTGLLRFTKVDFILIFLNQLKSSKIPCESEILQSFKLQPLTSLL